MGLPNIGPLELIIILAIALLIVGPGRLPEMGNAIGRTIREFRKASSDLGDAATEPSQASHGQPPNTLSRQVSPNTAAVSPAPASQEPEADGGASSDADPEGDRPGTTGPA